MAIPVTAVDQDFTTRYAEYYPNANNDGKTWGLTTYTSQFGRKGEKWHGADWPDKTTVEKAARDWVVFGDQPRYKIN